VSELRLAGASTLAEANVVLADFLSRFNARFAVEPAEPGLAYRPLDPDLKLDEVFCFTYMLTVGADNTVRLGEHRLQLLPTNGRQRYARARVEVHERLDGSLAAFSQGQCLATSEAPPDAPTLRARSHRAPAAHPAAGRERLQPPNATPHDQRRARRLRRHPGLTTPGAGSPRRQSPTNRPQHKKEAHQP
jgi:hypothetical protein